MRIFPEFTTDRLRLDRIRSEDAPAILELFSNPKVVEYYDLEAFSELAQAAQLIGLFDSRFETVLGIRWGLRLQSSGRLIGTCGFNSWSEKMRNGTIGYDLRPEYWQQGYMTEALSMVIHLAFGGLLPCGSLHRIQAETMPGNIASEKLLLKLGFQEEGLRRECVYWKGAYHDLKCFGLVQGTVL